MTAEGFYIGPRVAQHAIARAQEIAAFHKGFIGHLHDVAQRDAHFFFGLHYLFKPGCKGKIPV